MCGCQAHALSAAVMSHWRRDCVAVLVSVPSSACHRAPRRQLSVCCSRVLTTNATGWRCAEIDEGNCVRRCGDAKEALPGSKHTIMVPDPPSILCVPGQGQGGHVVTLCS